jgi:hypothetical protein
MVSVTIDDGPLKKKAVQPINLLFGALLNIAEVSTLGQPFEVVKTHMAANRSDSMPVAIKKTYGRGGLFGFYQGLVPWALIEASTKGSILLFSATEFEYQARLLGCSPALAGVLGGMGGGIVQSYTTMGFCTFMKTVEVTRHKDVTGKKSTFQIAREIYAKEVLLFN